MAEFCHDCYKKYFDKNVKKENLVIDDNLDLCEGCGEYKATVVSVRKNSILGTFKGWLIKKGALR